MFGFIKDHRYQFPVAWMCERLSVSRASFYRWLNPPAEPTPQAALRAERKALVDTVYTDAKGMAGAGQIVDLLRNEHDHVVCKATVLSLMKELGMRAKRMTAFKTTTAQDPDARTAHIKNHMVDKGGRRDFRSHAPGVKLVGDITYLRTGQGWLYLATVIDLHTRMIVGWSLSQSMHTPLVVDAMIMAKARGFIHRGSVFHSDRGAQYTSTLFQDWCKNAGVRQSMGATGVCWDNAVAESTFSSIKNEMYHHRAFIDRLTARTAVMEYIETWYNRRRPHTNNQGVSPQAKLDLYQASQNRALAA